MTQEQKDWIDNASYDSLLAKWRFAKVGDAFFQGDTGDYYKKVMNDKRKMMSQEEMSAASKRVGW